VALRSSAGSSAGAIPQDIGVLVAGAEIVDRSLCHFEQRAAGGRLTETSEDEFKGLGIV
jgi:hypothetical protein